MNENDPTDRTHAIAAALLDARRRATLVTLRGPWRPRDVGEVYAVHREVAGALWGEDGIAAWKVGAPSPVDRPAAAPIGAPQVLASGARIGTACRLRGIEGELAFRLGRDLPPLDDDAGDAAVIDAIECVHPTIEVVDSRLADFETADDLSKLADFQSHDALVLGAAVGDIGALDTATQPACLRVNGEVRVETTGGNAARDLLRMVRWLSRHAADGFGGLRAGQIVTTGTFTGLVFLAPGDLAEVELAGFGSATMAFDAGG